VQTRGKYVKGSYRSKKQKQTKKNTLEAAERKKGKF
jgi:hypothetical protein